MKITVISGKGGTGKTTLLANMAALADNLLIVDCDVDAPNLHLLLSPDVREKSIFKGARLAVLDEDKCTECGLCAEVCKFTAISPEIVVNSFKCDGCGLCAALCPEGALRMVEQETGNIFRSHTEYGPMFHAKLYPGADNSGKLVSRVRNMAGEMAEESQLGLTLIDGSPGIGCPVIASLNGVDAALVVTEPTKSGLADLKRILKVTAHFQIKTVVVINKYDLNEELTGKIGEYCEGEKIEIIGKIPFDPAVNDSLRKGKLLIEHNSETRVARALKEIWKKIGNTGL